MLPAPALQNTHSAEGENNVPSASRAKGKSEMESGGTNLGVFYPPVPGSLVP